ncbi:MAG TPA: response regulator [Roseiflexaceae bacterium]|nr:response regulator [Roseiflexaceae bacterium]
MQHSILVIDDDIAILATVSDILADEGYQVYTATNGAEGLAALATIEPNLILLDMRMPVLDGWGFAQQLRERGIAIPIVVMTATQDARRWAQEIGASHVLAKPFDLMDLIAVVQQVINRSTQQWG